MVNELWLAGRILTMPRREAESLLRQNGYSDAEAAEIAAAHTAAKAQVVVGSPRNVALTMIQARARTLSLEGTG